MLSDTETNISTQLLFAILTNDLEKVKTLIAVVVDLEAQGKLGGTPLHTAVEQGKADIVKLFIAAKADLNARDKYSDTPLHTAVVHGKADIVKLFIAAGVDLNARDGFGKTPLHLALCKNQSVMASLLYDSKADDFNIIDTAISHCPAFIMYSVDQFKIPRKLKRSRQKVTSLLNNIITQYNEGYNTPDHALYLDSLACIIAKLVQTGSFIPDMPAILGRLDGYSDQGKSVLKEKVKYFLLHHTLRERGEVTDMMSLLYVYSNPLLLSYLQQLIDVFMIFQIGLHLPNEITALILQSTVFKHDFFESLPVYPFSFYPQDLVNRANIKLIEYFYRPSSIKSLHHNTEKLDLLKQHLDHMANQYISAVDNILAGTTYTKVSHLDGVKSDVSRLFEILSVKNDGDTNAPNQIPYNAIQYKLSACK